MSINPPPKDPVFETKRQEWIRCLGSEDRNSVLQQVYDMVWCAGAYRVVLEARRIAEKDDRNRVKLNALTHRLLDRCFYQSQLVSIRRLMDNYPLTGDKGVFSLKSLVLDMRRHRTLFTRKNLFAAFDQAMDVEALRRAMLEHLWEKRESNTEADEWPVGIAPDFSERLHADIDNLARVTAAARHPDDTICESVFTAIEAKLAAMESICNHVNKFLAHAATPESRAEIDADETRLTFEDLWKAHETICRTCQFLDCFLLRQTSHAFLPEGPGNIFRYADEPLATTANVPALRATWTAYAKETVSWSVGSLEWLLGRGPAIG